MTQSFGQTKRQCKSSSKTNMTIVFDTSALSSLLSGDERIIKTLSKQSYERMVIPLSTDAEMRFGFSYGTRPDENLATTSCSKSNFP
jgi:predicted nucleic acid-binding protein